MPDTIKRQSGSLPRALAGMNLRRLEKWTIRETLNLTLGNRKEAARMLGIGERSLYRKIKEYEL